MLCSLDSEFVPSTDLIKVQPLTCVSYAYEDGRQGVLRWCDAKQTVADILTRHTAVGVSIATDMAEICLTWPDLQSLVWQAYEDNRIRCLKVEGKLLDIAEDSLNFVPGAADPKAPYGLATMAKRYAGIHMRADKNELRMGYGPLRDVDFRLWTPEQQSYPLDDAVAGLAVARGMPDAGPDKFRQARAAWIAFLWTAWGVRTDLARVARLRESLENRWMKARGTLADAGMIRKEKKGWVRNEKTMRQYVGALPGALLTPPSKTYPEGQWSLNGVLLQELGLDLDNPLLTAYADYSSINKRLTTEIPALEKGELHAHYNSLVQSGRMACGKENDDDEGSTNLTNLPRKGGIRECYAPRPGKIFFDADVNALEACTGAQACLDLVDFSEMANILVEGREGSKDPHIHTTAAILDISVPDALRRYEQHKKKGGDEEIATMRQFAKIANYGLAGGMGVPTFYTHVQRELKKDGEWALAKQTTVPVVERVWHAWRARYPEWPAYFEQNRRRLGRNNACQIEQLYSGRVRGLSGPRAYSELQNGWFQGLGSDAVKDWAWHVTREGYDETRGSLLLGSRVCIMAHDSLTGETDPEGAHDVAMRVGEILREVSPRWCPQVPLTTTPCLTTCFSKDAKDLYDSDGRLLPWSPKGLTQES